MPAQGFLGTGASFRADMNLVAQVLMGVTLVAGALLARRKLFTAHGICQATVLLLNVVMIGWLMWPSFQQQVLPPLPEHLGERYYAVAVIHAMLGGAAELLGLYIAVVAGTNLLPQRLRFQRWKLWMRVELVLWWAVIFTGIGVYLLWYGSTGLP
ncbi:MAG: DUF420 domain-containing protein [Acidobacteriia bacterium]|nr:DUF420 domain-containing protein [Terriglobia bacterium]